MELLNSDIPNHNRKFKFNIIVAETIKEKAKDVDNHGFNGLDFKYKPVYKEKEDAKKQMEVELPTFKLDELTEQGELTLEFSQILAMPSSLKEINNSVLRIEIIPSESNETNESTFGSFTWFVKSFSKK